MAEAARVNRISKERSEIQSQKLKAFFEEMPDPKEIIEYFQLWKKNLTHDEQHEEFNKQGLNFSVTNSAKNSVKNFSVADS